MSTATMSRAQVRNQFSAVTDRVARGHEEVHFGTRGEDEITMIASPILRELKRLAQRAAALEVEVASVDAAPDPWATLKQRVRERGPMQAGARSVRRLPESFDPNAEEEESAPSWDEMVRGGTRAPVGMEFVRRRARG